MPSRLRRFQESGQSHFITFSCRGREQKLVDDVSRDLFLATLERMRVRFRMCIYGYVIMPEHVHLLVNEPEEALLCDAIHFLKLSFSKRANRSGEAFWEKRYYDRNIRTSGDFVEKLKYIHRNPVKRGSITKPEHWKWSSFRHYALHEIGLVEIESEWTARVRETKQTGVPRRFFPPRLAGCPRFPPLLR